MKGAIGAAWAAGMAIMIWRQVHQSHRLPVPGALLGVTLLFAAGSVVADVYPASARLVTVAFFGLDVAALLGALPAGLSGEIQQSQTAASAASGQGGGQRAGAQAAPAAG